MFLSGELKGVAIPPELYNEFGWAYIAQADYLRQHPRGALIDTPLSSQVGFDLYDQLSRTIDEGAVAYCGLSKLPRQADEIPRTASILAVSTDALHFIECFLRQSLSQELAAIENAGTLSGEFAAIQAADNYRLVGAIHTACMESVFKPQILDFKYSLQHRITRPPLKQLPHSDTRIFRRRTAV